MSTKKAAIDARLVSESPAKAATLLREAYARAGTWNGAAAILGIGVKYLYLYRNQLVERGQRFKRAPIGRPRGSTSGRGKSRCGRCGEAGHNARKCPLPAPAPQAP